MSSFLQKGIRIFKSIDAMFGYDDFILKFVIDSNLLFGKSKIYKFGFGSNSTIVIFKVVEIENLKMTIQTLSFSNFSFMIS